MTKASELRVYGFEQEGREYVGEGGIGVLLRHTGVVGHNAGVSEHNKCPYVGDVRIRKRLSLCHMSQHVVVVRFVLYTLWPRQEREEPESRSNVASVIVVIDACP